MHFVAGPILLYMQISLYTLEDIDQVKVHQISVVQAVYARKLGVLIVIFKMFSNTPATNCIFTDKSSYYFYTFICRYIILKNNLQMSQFYYSDYKFWDGDD